MTAALLERAEIFAQAQERRAANAKEDAECWHHVAVAMLLRELAAALPPPHSPAAISEVADK